MRLTVSILVTLAALPILSSFFFFSCEETLEVCPACGEIEDGNINIIGDPRIDETFAAVQQLRYLTIQMSKRTDNAVAALSKTFEVAAMDNETDIGALARTVRDFFSAPDISMTGSFVRFGDCAVDRTLADATQNICEDRLCNIDRPTSLGVCRGNFSGQCTDLSSGSCFRPSNDACSGLCVGTCTEFSDTVCSGTCLGICDGPCLFFTEDGTCSGPCDGNCTGICDSTKPFMCPGQCIGACEESLSDAGCDDTDTFAGVCDAVTAGGYCRGYYYPEGCGANCPGCNDISKDCREISKFLAWSRMTCSGSQVQFAARAPGIEPEPTASIVARTWVIERILPDIANDYNWLSLLLEGYDLQKEAYLEELFVTSDVTPLDDGFDVYFDYTAMKPGEIPPVDLERAYLPIEALKARIYWLQRSAMNSSDGFRISAGTFDCLSPALSDAASIMLTMVPVNQQTGEQSISYTADTSCESATSSRTEKHPPCLYDLLQRQADLLALINTEPTQ